jgi:hypothetical protein
MHALVAAAAAPLTSVPAESVVVAETPSRPASVDPAGRRGDSMQACRYRKSAGPVR